MVEQPKGRRMTDLEAKYERRIVKQTQAAQRFDLLAFRVEGTGPKAEQDRQALRHSAAWGSRCREASGVAR